MGSFDPQILHMILILPGLLGLSLLYEGMRKREEEDRSWWLSVASGTLILVVAVILFFVFQWL